MSRVAEGAGSSKRDNAKVQQLIKQLMKVWSSKEVEENYQNYYLTYLDSLPDHLIDLEISREIKKTLQNKSHYFNINKSMALHNTSISKLKLAVQKVEKQQKIAQSDLVYICELIDELRNNNILVAQNTLNFNYESSSKSNSQFGFVHGNNYIFEKINIDHAFLKTSFLRKYIVFTNSYDPFFLHHYETAKTTNDQKYRSLPCIESLFNLSISKAYKVMKLQQEILQFLSGKIPYDRDQNKGRPKRKSYQFIKDSKKYQTVIEENEDENLSSFRLQNQPYINKKESQPDLYESPIFQRSKTEKSSDLSNNISMVNSKLNDNRYHLPIIQRRESLRQSTPKSSKVPDHYLFKSRRPRIQSTGNEEQISPVTFKRSKVGSNSINALRGREYENLMKLPTKFAKPAPINQQILRVEQAEIQQMRESIQMQPQDMHQNSPYAIRSNTNYSMLAPIQNKVSPNVALMLKNFKLKAGNIALHNLFIFLKELNIQERYRRIFEVGNWQHSIRNNQYYLHKFYINDVLMAISLCCALPEGDIVIKYWGPTTESDDEMIQFLFRKLLEHIEKQTICKTIFYNALEISQIFANGFTKQKQRIFHKQRSLPLQVDHVNYYPFLSIDFSIIAIPRGTSKEIQDKIVLPSNIYVPFSEKQFVCFNYLLIINKLINPGHFSSLGTYTTYLKNMKEVQTKMIKEQLFFNPYNLDSEASPINLLTVKIRNPIMSAFFVSNKPLIKLRGEEIYRSSQGLVVSLQLFKNNTRLYFGKGFKSLSAMLTLLKNRPAKSSIQVDYCVKMFGKRMRGKIHSINLRDEVCYGDIEMIFEWKDFLKGRIDHNFTELDTFGDGGSFYCMLQVQRQSIFAMEISDDNLI